MISIYSHITVPPHHRSSNTYLFVLVYLIHKSLIGMYNLSLSFSTKINTIIMANGFAGKEMTYNYTLLNIYVQIPDPSNKWCLGLINFDLWSM